MNVTSYRTVLRKLVYTKIDADDFSSAIKKLVLNVKLEKSFYYFWRDDILVSKLFHLSQSIVIRNPKSSLTLFKSYKCSYLEFHFDGVCCSLNVRYFEKASRACVSTKVEWWTDWRY